MCEKKYSAPDAPVFLCSDWTLGELEKSVVTSCLMASSAERGAGRSGRKKVAVSGKLVRLGALAAGLKLSSVILLPKPEGCSLTLDLNGRFLLRRGLSISHRLCRVEFIFYYG